MTESAAPPPASRIPPGFQDFIGTVIGERYQILEMISHGGMGVVYAAYDPDLDRKVAIKPLRPREPDADGSKEGHIRLFREAQALARLSHPNVITVYDVSTAYGQVFVAMEFVDGYTLREWLDEKKRSIAEIVAMFLLAGRGLAAAHAAGMVHRDFKPDNVLVSREGQVRVSDFGLARKVQSIKDSIDVHDLALLLQKKPQDAARQGGKPALKAQLTHPGAIMGTPAYMAPEQFRGQKVAAQADNFALAMMAYTLLVGVPYWNEEAGGDTDVLAFALRAHTGPVEAASVRAARAGVTFPAGFDAWFSKATATDPAARFASATATIVFLSPFVLNTYQITLAPSVDSVDGTIPRVGWSDKTTSGRSSSDRSIAACATLSHSTSTVSGRAAVKVLA